VDDPDPHTSERGLEHGDLGILLAWVHKAKIHGCVVNLHPLPFRPWQHLTETQNSILSMAKGAPSQNG